MHEQVKVHVLNYCVEGWRDKQEKRPGGLVVITVKYRCVEMSTGQLWTALRLFDSLTCVADVMETTREGTREHVWLSSLPWEGGEEGGREGGRREGREGEVGGRKMEGMREGEREEEGREGEV